MLLNWLELEDFTSHGSTRIEFVPGLNGVIGPMGSGKTSVVTALGVALFNYNPYNQKNLVRQGARVATIRLSFNSVIDGEELLIETRLGASSDTVLYCPQGPLARGKTDVYNQVRHHLGLSPETDLAALAENAIITRQGELVTPFLARTSERKSYFNAVLGVHEYESAWNKLAPAAKAINDQLTKLAESSARLEGELKGMEGLDERANVIKVEIGMLEVSLPELVFRADDLRQRINLDEQISVKLAEDRLALAQKEGVVVQVQSDIRSAEAMKKPYQAQLADLEEREKLLAENEGFEALVEKLEADYAAIMDEVSRIKGSKTASAGRLRKQIEDLESVEESYCPVCGESLPPRKKSKLLDDLRGELADVMKTSPREIELDWQRAETYTALIDKRGLAAKLSASRQFLTQRPKAIAELEACDMQISRLQAELGHAIAEAQALADAVKFAMFDESAYRSNRKALVELETEIGSQRTRLSILKNELISVANKTQKRHELQELHQAVQKSIADHQANSLRLAKIRDAIRQAGPVIAARLVESISAQASAIFTELMREHEEAALSWNEDYGITVRCSGTELDLREDHVNGGKKTMAALAVRLALLDHLGGLGLVILDEPTTNLDEAGRHMLATSIEGLCSRFGQGIVISHSDEFGSGLNGLVRLKAKNGVTEIE